MVSTRTAVNKMTPTVNSKCKIIIGKIERHEVDSKYYLDSDYLLQQGEVDIDLEQINTPLDRKFMKFLLKTKLDEPVTFYAKGVHIEFKLVHIERTVPIYELLDEDRLSRAIQHKEKGSELFKQEKHEAAFHRFRTSVQYLIFLNDKSIKNADDLYARVCNNMAMCQMKFKNYEHALELCSKVLKVDESNVKALYRRALCYTELKRYEEAHADLLLAQSRESKNTSVKKLLDVVQSHLRIEYEEYKMVVRNMFK